MKYFCLRIRLYDKHLSFFSFFLSLAPCYLPIVGKNGYCYTWWHSLTHTHTHIHTHKIGRNPLDEGSAHRRYIYLTTTHNTYKRQNTHAPGGFRTHNPSKRAAAGPRFRPHKHRDRPKIFVSNFISLFNVCTCPSDVLKLYVVVKGDRGGTVVKVLCYKSEGRSFEPSGAIGIFHWHKMLPIVLWPWGRLSL